MTRWVRLWEDMPNDPKWRVIAAKAMKRIETHETRVTIAEVLAVFLHMLTSSTSGNLDGWNDEVIASAIDSETSKIRGIREAMDGLVLSGNVLKGWEKRQPKREDFSTERVRAFRERKRVVSRFETSETQCNAPEENRVDISFLEKKKQKTRAREGNSNFIDFWKKYPHKIGKADAGKAFDVALSRGEFAVIMAGLARYIQEKPADRPWCNPGTWLRQARWLDEPAPALGAGPASNGHDASRPRPAPGPPGETLEQRTDRWRKWQEENP
jgi:hypothetical protein